MSGYKNFNFDHFDEVESELNKKGYSATNPAHIARKYLGDLVYKIDKEPIDFNSFDFKGMIKEQSDALLSCDSIYMLKGWEYSTGAKNEIVLAIQNNKEVILE